MTLLRVSVYHIAVISLMNQSLDVQMPWPSSAQEEKFQFFRQGFLVNRRYIWDHSTVSVVLVNLHAEFSIVRDSQTEDPGMQSISACLFVVRALRSLRPARTCATKLLRDFNLHLQPSMPRSWSKLRGWNRWVTNRSLLGDRRLTNMTMLSLAFVNLPKINRVFEKTIQLLESTEIFVASFLSPHLIPSLGAVNIKLYGLRLTWWTEGTTSLVTWRNLEGQGANLWLPSIPPSFSNLFQISFSSASDIQNWWKS